MNPLEEATTQQLFDELKRRTRHVLLAYVQPTGGPENEEDYHLVYGGGLTACIGLAERARAMLVADSCDEMRLMDDDEEDDE